MFKNTFHYLNWDNDTSTIFRFGTNFQGFNADTARVSPYLFTQVKTRRTTELPKFGQRSKYIVRPEAVDLLGNHNVWALIIGKVTYVLLG